MSNAINLTTPLTEEKVRSLKMGDEVYITGTIFTGRDAAHKRLCDVISKGEKLPLISWILSKMSS
ncbi:fumarate hydratase C-terminal domain-containing protein, partial [Candidatus Margulisiibacteriota bacterium]